MSKTFRWSHPARMKHNNLCLQTDVAARESVFQAATLAIRAICAVLSAQIFPLAPLKVVNITGGLDDISRGFYYVKYKRLDDITGFYCMSKRMLLMWKINSSWSAAPSGEPEVGVGVGQDAVGGGGRVAGVGRQAALATLAPGRQRRGQRVGVVGVGRGRGGAGRVSAGGAGTRPVAVPAPRHRLLAGVGVADVAGAVPRTPAMAPLGRRRRPAAVARLERRPHLPGCGTGGPAAGLLDQRRPDAAQRLQRSRKDDVSFFSG